MKKQIQTVIVEFIKKRKKQNGLIRIVVVDTIQPFLIIQSIYDISVSNTNYCTCNLWSSSYYSIIGLVAIFSASVIPIAVMGVVLETIKLVSDSHGYIIIGRKQMSYSKLILFLLWLFSCLLLLWEYSVFFPKSSHRTDICKCR